jgi:hypothetical protein
MLTIKTLNVNPGTKVQCLRNCVNAECYECQRKRITIGDNGACAFFAEREKEEHKGG